MLELGIIGNGVVDQFSWSLTLCKSEFMVFFPKMTRIIYNKLSNYCNRFTTSLTYSDITVAIAAPATPIPKQNIKIASSIAFNTLPAPENEKQNDIR